MKEGTENAVENSGILLNDDMLDKVAGGWETHWELTDIYPEGIAVSDVIKP